MVEFREHPSGFVARQGQETVLVETWGEHAVRVRSTVTAEVVETPGSALLEAPSVPFDLDLSSGRARLANGRLVVEVGGERYEMRSGGYLRLPTDVPYAYVNPGRATTRFIRVILMP